MNVALLIDSLGRGGSESVVRRLAAGLAQRGHRPHIYCLKSADVATAALRAAGVMVREAQSTGRNLTLPLRLGGWLRRDRIELVHAHSCSALVQVFAPAKLLGLPIVHVRHGWPLQNSNRYTAVADRLDAWISHVVLNCESGRERLPRGRAAANAVHIPNGVDITPLPREEARAELETLCGRALPHPVILSIGNVRREKDTLTLLRAFARLRERHPTASLACVGGVIEQDYWSASQDAVRALGLEGSVHFTGPVTHAARLMPAADIYCLSSCQEAMPNVVLEAMAQRVPLVATTVGDVGRLGPRGPDDYFVLHHERTALLAPPRDAEALADAIARALHEPDAARRRADVAYARYQQRFTTASMVGQYEALYADCLRHGPRMRRVESRKPHVVMLGPAPPLVGGMVTSVSLLTTSRLRSAFRLTRLATAAPTPAERSSRPLAVLQRHLAAWLALVRVLLTSRVDVLHIHTCSRGTFYRNLLDLWTAKLLGSRVVLHIRGGQFAAFCAAARGMARRLIRSGLAAADAVIVLSRPMADALRPHIGSAALHVVPNAYDPTMSARPHVAEDRPCRFLYLAELRKAKGVDDLILAAAELRRWQVRFELTLAGPVGQEARRRYEQVIRAAKLADCVRLAGPVTGDAKRALLAAHDCFVHPSHSEGLPNAVLEAAAAGLPVIATAVGAVPEVLGAKPDSQPLAPLVPSRDVNALAIALRDLALDPDRRTQTAARLQAHVVENYHLDRVAQRLAEVYEPLVAALPLTPLTSDTADTPPPPAPSAHPADLPTDRPRVHCAV